MERRTALGQYHARRQRVFGHDHAQTQRWRSSSINAAELDSNAERAGMSLQQSIEHARPDGFDQVLARTADALASLRERHANETLPLLRLPERRDDIAAIIGLARLLGDDFTDIVFLGTGGSSLGGQTLAQLGDHMVPGLGLLRRPRLHFMDNLDPDTFAALLEQAAACHDAVCGHLQVGRHRRDADADRRGARRGQAGRARSAEPFRRHHRAGQARQRSGLRETLPSFGAPILDHDPGVGGRFSVLTNVGLLPAAVCGLDIGAVRQGAAQPSRRSCPVPRPRRCRRRSGPRSPSRSPRTSRFP